MKIQLCTNEYCHQCQQITTITEQHNIDVIKWICENGHIVDIERINELHQN